MTLLTGYIVIYPPEFIEDIMELDMDGVPVTFSLLMVLLALAHFVLANFIEVSIELNPFVP